MALPQRSEAQNVMQAAKLDLYLAGASSQSKLIEIKLRQLLDQELEGAYSLDVVDVLAYPDRADQANVLLTPTLVRVAPRPARRLVGTLDQREQLLWLIGNDHKPQPSAIRDRTIDSEGQALIDLCPDGVVLVDQRGEIITSNAAGLRMLGLEGQSLDGQVLGLPLSTGMAINLAKVGGKPIDVSLAERQWDGQPAYVITMRDLGDMQTRNVQAERSSLAADGETQEIGKLLQANAALTRTIEESAKVMEDLRTTREELERSNDEFQSFAHRVAHDIKAPLRNISQITEFVLEDEHDRIAAESRNLLNKIPVAAKRLNALLDNLLAIARVGSKQTAFTNVDLNVVLKWVTSDLEPMIKGALGVCDVGKLPKVMGDAGELYQLFMNLVGNAVKYHQPGVPPIVNVAAEQGVACPQDETAMARIVVSDNGIGFEDAQAEKIFEPFTRLVGKKDFEGSGIGLATVKKIVTRHEGMIHATGKTGEGATFIVELVECPHH